MSRKHLSRYAVVAGAIALLSLGAKDASAQARSARSNRTQNQPTPPPARDVSTPQLAQAPGAMATCGLDGEDVLCRSNARLFSIAVTAGAQGTCASIALARTICERVINHVDAMELVLRARVRATVTEGADNRGAYLAAMHARLPDALVHQRAWCSQLVAAAGGATSNASSTNNAQRAREDLTASSMAVVIHRAGREVSGPALATVLAAAPRCRAPNGSNTVASSPSAPRNEPLLVSGGVAVSPSAPSVANAPEPRVVGAVNQGR
ncbi:MAG: hypothetical protein JNK05_06285 [Myxococcales bacterium]|nr:hypothetical protein [Myxococcales bacterium]